MKGIKEIYVGKGKIKGIYGDPAKEKLNKLTPKILPRGQKCLPTKSNYCPFGGQVLLETQSL